MEEIKDWVKEDVTEMFEQVLDYVQVAVPEGNWKPIRGKILRVGNSCIRKLHSRLDEYDNKPGLF